VDGDINIAIDALAFSKFALGQPVPRNEDPTLLCGEGRYTDDLSLPGQAYAVIVRSRYAHGVINAIDTEDAQAMPGVLGIYTGPDLTAAGIKPMPLGQAIPTSDGTPMHRSSSQKPRHKPRTRPKRYFSISSRCRRSPGRAKRRHDELIAGGGTGGSKSLMASGTAIVGANEKVIEQGRQIAAHVLEAAVADVEFLGGRFVIAGTDRFIDIMELATMISRGLELPPELPQTLDVQHIHESSPSAFPNGCHIAEVEIDPETRVVVVKYSMVNDFGVIVNPLLVAGQAHGGVVQGIGQALMERTVFDEEGQFLTGSLTDYALPRATHAVMLAIDSHPVPAKTNPLGAKGCGEAGCAGSLPAVMNAVVDALSEYGIRHIDMPATPFRVWQAIQAARGAG
jgi:CO/xanthine dehydrogenase Mo-binding subunit